MPPRAYFNMSPSSAPWTRFTLFWAWSVSRSFATFAITASGTGTGAGVILTISVLSQFVAPDRYNTRMRLGLSYILLAGAMAMAQDYDLLLRGGRVIDPRNNRDGQ